MQQGFDLVQGGIRSRGAVESTEALIFIWI